MEWIGELNFHYMIIFVIVSYGIHHKPQMGWIRNLIGKWVSTWMIGLLIAGGYIMASPKAFIDNKLNKEYLALLLHSYGICMVFMYDAMRLLHTWGEEIDKRLLLTKTIKNGKTTEKEVQ